jgi:hypothetical protein
MTTKQTEQLKKVTGMTEIPFVSEGIASETSGFVVSEDGLTALVEASVANETAAARIAELEGSLATAQTAQQTAEASLATANTALATSQARVTELEAKVTELEAEDAKGSETGKKEDAFTGTTDAMSMDFQKELLNKV